MVVDGGGQVGCRTSNAVHQDGDGGSDFQTSTQIRNKAVKDIPVHAGDAS